MSVEEKYLSINDLAKRFCVCRRTIERWNKKGLIKSYYFGPKTIRFNYNDVEQFVKQSTIEVKAH